MSPASFEGMFPGFVATSGSKDLQTQTRKAQSLAKVVQHCKLGKLFLREQPIQRFKAKKQDYVTTM